MTAFDVRITKICRVCRGNATKTLGKGKCGVCKKKFLDYVAEGLRPEVEQLEYLRLTWQKCRTFRQVSTGYKKLDVFINLLFGQPHTNGEWMNYDLIPGKVVMNDFIIIRTIDEVNLLWNRSANALAS